MTLRAPFLLALFAGFLTLSACGGEAPLPEPADSATMSDRPIEEQALYLAGLQEGESVREQDTDSLFLFDEYRRGMQAGFSADSSVGLAFIYGYQTGMQIASATRIDSTLSSDITLYLAGLRDGYEDRDPVLTQRQRRSVQEVIQMRQIERQAASNPQAQAMLNELNRTQPIADSILTATRAREGAQTAESGVLYIVTAEGEGDSPTEGDRILLAYEARLPDGTPIDGTPQPMDMVLNDELEQRMPVGVVEMLYTMKAGESREIILPPSMGFGRFGIPGTPVGPNTVLTYVVQLVDVLDPVSEAPAAPAVPAPGQ